MHLSGVKIRLFKGTSAGKSSCTQKGKILNPFLYVLCSVSPMF